MRAGQNEEFFSGLLVKEGSGVGANVLKNVGVDLAEVRREVEKLVKKGDDTTAIQGKLAQTPRAKTVVEFAIEEARNLNHNYVGTEHLLLGLLRERDGVAAQVLTNLKLQLNDLRQEVLSLLGQHADGAAAAKNTPLPGAALSSTHQFKVGEAFRIAGVVEVKVESVAEEAVQLIINVPPGWQIHRLPQ